MPCLVQNVTPNADQGNGSPDKPDQGNSSPEDPVANARNAARKAMAIHIDGSVIETKNGSHCDRFSDAAPVDDVVVCLAVGPAGADALPDAPLSRRRLGAGASRAR